MELAGGYAPVDDDVVVDRLDRLGDLDGYVAALAALLDMAGPTSPGGR